MTITRSLFLLLSVLFFSSLSINAYAGPMCGDSNIEGTEECDEGNIAASDICTNTTTSQGGGECTLTFCGDNVAQPTNGNNVSEQCDDGNNTNGDGCDASCQNESQPVCGNGMVESGEQCDDLNLPTATCDASCMIIGGPICGNGVVESGEQCDNLNLPTATCDTSCMTIAAPICGNGVVESGEQCDNLNLPTATCDASCMTIAAAICGNSIVETGEQCEPPGTATCDTSCQTIVVTPPLDASTVNEILPSGESVIISTGSNQTLSNVSSTAAVNGPEDVKILFGVISYETTAPVGGTQQVRLTFSSKMPDDGLVVYKVLNSGAFELLPSSTWKRIDKKTLIVFLTDGDPATDLDGVVNGMIVDPIAIGQFNDIGGCTIGGRSVFDPLWLLLFAVPAIGSLRNRARK